MWVRSVRAIFFGTWWTDRTTALRSKEKQPLKSVMRKSFNPPVSVGVSMEELLERSMRQSFIPVVDDRGAFVGIVTRQNIIRQLTMPKVEPTRDSRERWDRELAGASV